ncbi:hypothetical protein FQV27_01610 [Paracoccus aurantiacus]|uniref:Antifreeze protein n=1 Tax=Paracoccus aurantiacus TaxID=2599412 RepID=A0A5C6S8C4_9RHOB|nr:hypothetical protein [Paracoccus aurantiacus]TXB70594.1 hypothetical protein FQV27_01610 [Paracoccus aurantiacus]
MDWTDRRLWHVALFLGAALMALPATAQGPLSANDWLRGKGTAPSSSSAWRPGDPVPPDAVVLRPTRPPVPGRARPGEVADSASAVPVGVSRLGAANSDGAGVISARQAGLRENFWSGTTLDTAIRMIRANPTLPAAKQVARRVIEAQIAPPSNPDQARIGEFFTARVDQLIADGALPSARVMLQGAGPDNAQTFRRLFDLSLLLGGEDQTCARMNDAPGIAPDPAARIFCMAQSGDWPAAATVFMGAQRLGMLDPQMTELLRHYLDDSSADGAEPLTPPQPMTPLAFRLHEGIGQPLPTGDLDLKYAWADLDERAGWKAQLEAAERLARAGVLPSDTLQQLYGAQSPAASGGVWERAAAMQALDGAIATDDPARIGPALTHAFRLLEATGLRDSFASMVAGRVAPETLTGEPQRLALWLQLWSGNVEVMQSPQEPLDQALLALASGGQPEPLSPALGALAPVFASDLPPLPDPDDGIAIAPALYGALADADAGTQGDVTRAARGVQMLRQLGLIADARRIATQVALDPLLKGAAQ